MANERLPRDPLKREALVKAVPPEAPARPFVHLRVHSAYSLLEGALPVGKIVGHAVKDAAPAIAVTDTNNLFGALEFAQKATKEGVQPLVGCLLAIDFGDAGDFGSSRKQGVELFSAVMIAATEVGYANLVRIVSRAYLDTSSGDETVHVKLDWFEGLSEGIICLSGGPRGPVGAAIKSGHAELAESRLLSLQALFGDRLYVEIERVAGYDRAVEAATIELAYRHRLPLVATNEAFFPRAATMMRMTRLSPFQRGRSSPRTIGAA